MGNERKKYNALILKVSNFLKNHYLKKHTRTVSSCSIHDAKTIGITFKVTSKEELAVIKKAIKFISENSNSDITALGYIPNKKPEDFYLTQKGLTFFSDKDLDFFYRPKADITDEFIKTKFDILIDLDSKDFYPMNYVLMLSEAKFKIGRYDENTPFDFMLSIDKKDGLDYFCDQVISYLSKIKK